MEIIDDMVFKGLKYIEASNKALTFIKSQLDVNKFKYNIIFARKYRDDYEGDVIWGYVEGLLKEEEIKPEHIRVSYYDFYYKGKVSGQVFNLPDYTGYGVRVSVVHDTTYEVITCPINEDGTFSSEILYKEVYHKNKKGKKFDKIAKYKVDVEVGEGIKEFKLVSGISGDWQKIKDSKELTVYRYVYSGGSIVENGYGYLKDFNVNLYTFSDAEYLNYSCNIFNVGDGVYIWYAKKVYKGHKIGKLVKTVFKNGKKEYQVVGIAGAVTNLKTGRLPASFLIPPDDPQYNKDGTKALGAFGYMLNSRTWAYDVGLALLVFTTSRDYSICKEMLRRMQHEQNSDGSFNFSYDIYIGQLFEGYVRTGALGWLLWGMCYYTMESRDKTFLKMIEKTGDYLLSRQVTDKSDARYGLLKGGYGSYNMEDYSYNAEEIEWCSVEHQCSALQGLIGCSLIFRDNKYRDAVEIIKNSLYLSCYDKGNGRFYQGINGDIPDSAWALDCTTWAGSLIFSVIHSDTARDCADTASIFYSVRDVEIEQSREKDYYNTAYSSDETFSGFKPYSDVTEDYAGAPELVWTEGTLGYALLSLILGEKDEAQKYVDECIKLQNCNGSTGGVIYTTATYGMLPWEFHVWESVVSSSWLYLIINNPDVLFPRTLSRVYYMAKINKEDDKKI